MKKRNRLLSSSQQSKLFKSETLSPHKNRHIAILSLLALTGIFITGIVLATSEPSPTTSQTQSVALPNMPPVDSSNTTSSEQSAVALSSESPTRGSQADIQPLSEVEPIQPNVSLDESTEVERLHLNQQPAPSATTVTPTVSDALSPEEVIAPSQSSDELSWQEIEVKSGDNLSLIFPRAGLGARDVYEVAQTAGEEAKALLNLRPGQIVRFGTVTDSEQKLVLKQLQLQLNPMKTLTLTATEKGFETDVVERELDKQRQLVAGEIQSSLFVDGQKAGMSDKLIMEMAHIFGWDVDFALDLRQGDSFKVIYNENFLDGEKVADGEILAAEFTNRGKTFRAVLFTDKNGESRFYTPDGDSMRKAFTRTPVPISRISSGFNPNRKHPVLQTNRPHRGVDYAAATGTPILATGDGKVDFVGTKGGYGRTVILSHGGRYTTLFAHMSRFKKGIRAGQRVRQGDVIGYIGSSGLATGPHLHYEFRVDGIHKNPLTVTLPKAEPIPSQYLAEFKTLAQPLLASLDNLQVPTLALRQD
ncbi:peptidoglycan DD-metalloendopeptidase family protein [Methylophaga pinxianii]|uniref:peptidoglycan DD-metalloendopeptidase family protein n=1 Tax=Methylophaga pinxianii TaxID=2881052 RepID=UPI001CF38F38|nr:peptidoglycan DD-metalloendopeptidase family protein [Methylophaga pinxianii]MCB2425892.1 peptidoglycan DD-metalloendopeptidase family protein [Methylophaga pinxianii]UPH47006.1 peptidoglycan DD-metalloendopeptidase family protein [Methylophaga pinxianii]